MLVESLGGLERTVEGEDRRALLVSFLHAYAALTPDELDEVERRLTGAGKTEVVQMLTHPWQEKGRVEGVREAIVGFLEARFGPVPAPIPQTLAGIWDVQLLDQLTRAAATAGSLEEFARNLPESPAETRA